MNAEALSVPVTIGLIVPLYNEGQNSSQVHALMLPVNNNRTSGGVGASETGSLIDISERAVETPKRNVQIEPRRLVIRRGQRP